MRLAFVLALLAVGCGSDSGGADMSAAVDMTMNADLFGVDYAGDYNCVQLNSCESDPLCQNQLCQTACRNMATPSALAKDQAVQQCLNDNCPQASDLGQAICAPDQNNMRSAACKQCLTNTQVPQAGSCTPPNAPECHACVDQVAACRADKN